MSEPSNTPREPDVHANSEQGVWFKIGGEWYTMRHDEAWALAWQIIGVLVDQKRAVA